jgi:hypothetical protein
MTRLYACDVDFEAKFSTRSSIIMPWRYILQMVFFGEFQFPRSVPVPLCSHSEPVPAAVTAVQSTLCQKESHVSGAGRRLVRRHEGLQGGGQGSRVQRLGPHHPRRQAGQGCVPHRVRDLQQEG